MKKIPDCFSEKRLRWNFFYSMETQCRIQSNKNKKNLLEKVDPEIICWSMNAPLTNSFSQSMIKHFQNLMPSFLKAISVFL